MADLVLSDSLVDEYFKYKFGDKFDTNKMRKLLKYIQPFFLKDTHKFMSDPAMPMQLSSDPLIEIIDINNDEELVQNSSLKLMVIDRHISATYTTININVIDEKIGLRFGGIYPNSIEKNKAQKHIKALISDGSYVKVSDSYIDSSDLQWEKNKEILRDIIPYTMIDLVIESGSVINRQSSLSGLKKAELESFCIDWTVKANQYNDRVKHDRYIETDKVKILLSSGLYNLSSSSNKDFTYIVDLKY